MSTTRSVGETECLVPRPLMSPMELLSSDSTDIYIGRPAVFTYSETDKTSGCQLHPVWSSCLFWFWLWLHVMSSGILLFRCDVSLMICELCLSVGQFGGVLLRLGSGLRSLEGEPLFLCRSDTLVVYTASLCQHRGLCHFSVRECKMLACFFTCWL